jgi:hypothetical protein
VSTPEQEMFEQLVQAINDVASGLGEAATLMGSVPERPSALESLTPIQRTAARAFLKAIEQLQDLTAKALRLVLILEQEDLAGLSARAIADRAVSIGIMDDSDEWSALVKLRNRLAHEYPLSRDVQLARLNDAWAAQASLLRISAGVLAFGKRRIEI